MHRGNSAGRAALAVASLFGILAACGGGGTGTGSVGAVPGNGTRVIAFEYGRLADVYGLKSTASGSQVALYQTDVMVGSDIQDQRKVGDNLGDNEILYDFISANPDTLQPRLFITREIGSQEFLAAYDALDDRLHLIAPGVFGQNVQVTPHTVVPRNGAMRLVFNRPLQVTDDFFVERHPVTGQVTGIKNTEAVQVLKITGDPNSGQPGVFEVLPVRIVVRGSQMILDPVLLGSEGLQYNTQNNAAGLPPSPDQLGANIRVALALDGPLRLPGLRADAVGQQTTGVNNSGLESVIRDFRSGNANDSSAEISRGFIRDPIPPRIVGEIITYLEAVEDVDTDTQQVTIYKNGVNHELDRGDVFRLVVDNSGEVVATTEIVVDPVDDRGNPSVQHVRVLVRRTKGLKELAPSIPAGLSQTQVEEWLVENAPRAILVTEFTASRKDPETGQTIEDDPRYFITFAPTPLPDETGKYGEPNENISPFAGAVIRFTKPVDLTTVGPLDTFFFATKDLIDEAEKATFIAVRDMDPASFNEAKYRTPHLIASRRFDEDKSQTALRLQPPMGFFLSKEMRQPGQNPLYFMHIVGGSKGILDLSGNAVDFQSDTAAKGDGMVIPFTVDARETAGGQAFFPENLVVSVCRRYADQDEDEQPSYYRQDEIQTTAMTAAGDTNVWGFTINDIFGGVFYPGDGTMVARPAARVSRIADNLNQAPVADQNSELRWCPFTIATPSWGTQTMIASNTANTMFGQGIQNPMNPYGCRLQTLWREVDLSLSRLDPDDFNLDLEQMYWAPFTGAEIIFDEFDQVSLFLGHSEKRPEPCVGNTSALPEMQNSGLRTKFENNFLFNPTITGLNTVDSRPAPHVAYLDANLVIDANLAITEPNGINRYLPLPTFEKPYFVWRDETVMEQGAAMGAVDFFSPLFPSDTYVPGKRVMDPYIISPFLTGAGTKVKPGSTCTTNITKDPQFVTGFWVNMENYKLADPASTSLRSQTEFSTGGQVGTIALPLLADFWTICDSPSLPAGNGFLALGVNGWQIAVTVTSNFQPNFRAYSAGIFSVNGAPAKCVEPGTSQWTTASGGFRPGGSVTRAADNSLYWIWADFVKRQTVVTAGFVDLFDPHRVDPALTGNDPRLGPFLMNSSGQPLKTHLPELAFDFDPPLTELGPGTQLVTEWRAAGPVDPVPWKHNEEMVIAPGPPKGGAYCKPDERNFPLDPFKAGDAGIRKFDVRSVPGASQRNWWTYYYNRIVTRYTTDPNDLFTTGFLFDEIGPNDAFTALDLRYVNWRFIMVNNVDANPPVSPKVDTFALTYRFKKTN